MAYYLKFAEEFPTVKHLATANSDKVMKLWQGLGYYSRARNLHTTAKIILNEHKGQFPDEYQKIIALKGIGEYTAAAIASFAFDQPHAVVDGNVYRLLSRVFGIATPIDSGKGKKEFYALANELLDRKQPALFNQAIMEFGSMQCKPSGPDCSACPLNHLCVAHTTQQVGNFPVKAKKTKVRDRYFNYLLLRHKGTLVLNKRGKGDIWNSLYDFPNIESNEEMDEATFLKTKEWKKIIGGVNYHVRNVSPAYKHLLSHQKINARFWEIDCKESLKKQLPSHYLFVKEEDINEYAVPRLIENYLKKG